MKFLIFSKDRACQLDLLLRSIDQFCKNDKRLYQISILYTFSEDHEESYNECYLKNIKNGYNWVRETDFESQTKELIKGRVCLLTDDTVFFRDFHTHDKLKNNIFSLRLGYNTYIQDHINKIYQPYLKPSGYNGDLIWWNPNDFPPHCNYGYPFSFDGHVYPDGLLYDLLKDSHFENTNEIEGILHSFRNSIDIIYANTHSSCVNIPCNNISGLTGINERQYSVNFLKEKYMLGNKISLSSLKNVPIIGCHQNLEFVFYEAQS